MTALALSRVRTGVHRAIFQWYRRHGRKLPWRGIRDPYRILLSEIMLQQTQVSRVHEKYPLFLKDFPNIHALAAGPKSAVIRTWQGMGYNNRAVRLHMLACEVVSEHSGKIPRDEKKLLALPGIGRYTANAILSSAFGKKLPVVDINIRRLFSRLLWDMHSRAALRPEREIWDVASNLLPDRSVYEWNQALMDLGATVCSARAPQCPFCPLARFCRSRTRMQKPDAPKLARLLRKPEPSYRGVPTRMHRGRIIEVLRQMPEGKWIGIKKLSKRAFDQPADEDVRWVTTIVGALERDGLVKRQGDRVALG
jgi:A/G-specific adenine glycosylase